MGSHHGRQSTSAGSRHLQKVLFLPCRGDLHGGGPFVVVFIGSGVGITNAYAYSSEAGAWSVPTSIHNDIGMTLYEDRGVLIGDDIFFKLTRNRILKYDLGKDCFSLVDSPSVGEPCLLVCAGNGSLGIASIKDSSLCLWSRMEGKEGIAGRVQCSITKLEKLVPTGYSYKQTLLINCTEDGEVIFVSTDVGTFMIELKSVRARKVCKHRTTYDALPFTSFYTPSKFLAFFLFVVLDISTSMCLVSYDLWTIISQNGMMFIFFANTKY